MEGLNIMIKMLAAPVIGAIIGYCTNWLAVKMLFRPMEAKYLGSFKIPFTPGVIPKGKIRLAESVSKAINEQLLTKEVIEARLLSPEVTSMVWDAANDIVESAKSSGASVREVICSRVDEGSFNVIMDDLEKSITERIMRRLRNEELGDLISDHLTKQLGNAMSGSFIGMMMGDSLAEKFGNAISASVEKYIDDNGDRLIGEIVHSELSDIGNMKFALVINGIENSGYDIAASLAEVYPRFVHEKAYEAMKDLNIGEMAAESIRSMDNAELERLVMSTMKTELGAVINLGALIGLVLGLINMAIYLY